MSPATRRSLQTEERLWAPIRSNGNGHALSNGNGRSGTVANGHGKGTSAVNGTNGNGASNHRPKPRVFVGTENRLLREALSRMPSKNGEIEVITSEAAEPFHKSAEHAPQDSLQKGDLPAQAPPGALAAPAIHDAEILLLSSKGNLDQDLSVIRQIRLASTATARARNATTLGLPIAHSAVGRWSPTCARVRIAAPIAVARCFPSLRERLQTRREPPICRIFPAFCSSPQPLRLCGSLR